jgi:hypothetical protein
MKPTHKQTASGRGWRERVFIETFMEIRGQRMYTAVILLFITCALIVLPEMPENVKSFLLAAFACVALLQS